MSDTSTSGMPTRSTSLSQTQPSDTQLSENPSVEGAFARDWVRPLRQMARSGGDGGVYILLAVMFVITWLLVVLDGGRFDLENILVRTVALGIVAAGQTFVIIGGSIDLSVVPLITISAMLTASVSTTSALSVFGALGVVLGLAVLVGLANGLIVAVLGVNGFIATLGMALVLQGQLSSNFAENAPASVPPALENTLGYGQLWFVPWSLVLEIGVIVVAAFVLRSTRFGAHVYAAGGDAATARNAGVRVGRTTVGVHVVCSVCAALAGFYLAARYRVPNVEVGSNGTYDLQSIAVVVLGGAALLGGRGTVGRTAAAVIVFALIDVAFNQLQFDSFLQIMVRGVIIIVAVASYTWRGNEEAS